MHLKNFKKIWRQWKRFLVRHIQTTYILILLILSATYSDKCDLLARHYSSSHHGAVHRVASMDWTNAKRRHLMIHARDVIFLNVFYKCCNEFFKMDHTREFIFFINAELNLWKWTRLETFFWEVQAPQVGAPRRWGLPAVLSSNVGSEMMKRSAKWEKSRDFVFS